MVRILRDLSTPESDVTIIAGGLSTPSPFRLPGRRRARDAVPASINYFHRDIPTTPRHQSQPDYLGTRRPTTSLRGLRPRYAELSQPCLKRKIIATRVYSVRIHGRPQGLVSVAQANNQ